MKAKEWETKKRSSKGSLLSHIVTSYIHPFSQELIILGIVWGKSLCRKARTDLKSILDETNTDLNEDTNNNSLLVDRTGGLTNTL